MESSLGLLVKSFIKDFVIYVRIRIGFKVAVYRSKNKNTRANSFVRTIPSSGQATLICDGTNFYNANTTQAGGTALSIISGTLGS